MNKITIQKSYPSRMALFYFCIIFCQLMIRPGSSNSHSKDTSEEKVDTNEEITEYEAADVHYPDKVKLMESKLINSKSLHFNFIS